MFLPIQDKPKTSNDYSRMAYEFPNLITKEVATELREFATNTEVSGLHRRNSKTPAICKASFYTCLVFHHNHSIYELLDPAWKQFMERVKSDITFIEPYEIKSYVVGDEFSNHNDVLTSIDDITERKMNLIVQLCEEDKYDGGDLMVGPFKCSRKLGTGIFFPSHYVHSVTPITRGTRFSLVGHAWGPRRI